MRLANELDIKGEVKNSGGNVTIIAQGNQRALESFLQRLVAIFDIKSYTKEIIDGDYADFKIVHSTNDNEMPFITPDLATCKECEAELFDSNNRRHEHPFISCVNCGPRYTIIKSLPYDRENTTMGIFPMCDDCAEEYTTPQDRRCHAQTIACKTCGPKTNITIQQAIDLLNDSNIIAIKDIGGYHLACKCDSDLANKLREIKGREKKPFAIMFSSISEIEDYCEVSDKERELLQSPARPIVLLQKKKDMPEAICNDSDYIGAFLPCNPIQIMILKEVSPLIMTSANLSGEPIIIDDDEIKKFGVPILSHNREILTPIDDSVVQVNNGKVQFIRRARGYVPLSINIGKKTSKRALCMGSDLKSSFAIINGEYAYPSQYFGDLEDERYYKAYEDNIARFCRLHSFKPDIIIADKHPLYHSAQLFETDVRIQHHLAHAYSVVAEHHIKGDALHFVFDGTGYGDDGAIWGAEVFYNTDRVAHLEYTRMLASDEISKNADLALACYDKSNELINKAVENNINVINSSSMGRLFDAVCAALDIKHYNTYEGECAIALESVARTAAKAYHITPSWNPADIINQIKGANAPRQEVALGFHIMLSELILNTAQQYDTMQITLSGGCFVNRILMTSTTNLLEANGYTVYVNEQVSPGDNGICLGQAYLGTMEE